MANRLTGKIVRVNADRSGALIGLDNDPSIGPQENHFRLNLDHANYNAVYSLALAAAANRWPVTIVAAGEEDLDPSKEAPIRRIAVDWRASGMGD